MRERPVLMLSILFLLGVLYGDRGWLCFPASALVLLLYSEPWKERGVRRLCFSVGLVLAFALGWLRMEQETAFRSRSLDVLTEGEQVQLSGKIVRVEPKARCNYYYLTDCHIRLSDQTLPCNDVLAYMSDDDGSIGQILVLQGTITLFDEPANEGGFDARAFYRSRKVDFGLWVSRVCSVNGKPDAFRSFLQGLRQKLLEVIDAFVKDEGVLSAMLLGDKSALDPETKTLYQNAGISHVLAISGLHMSLLGLGLYRLLKRRLGLSYPASAGWTALFLLAYTVMTGASVSALRAVLMLFVFLLAEVLGLGYDLLSGLGLAILVLLWDNPFFLEYTGFQFSVAAVLGIGVGGRVLTLFGRYCPGGAAPAEEEALDETSVWGVRWRKRQDEGDNEANRQQTKTVGRIIRRLQKEWDSRKEGLCISLAIQLFTLPLVAYNYYELPVYAMVLNLFVLAGVGSLLLLAAAGAVLGLFVPVLGKILLAPCGLLLEGYRKLCEASLALPGARYICGKPAGWRILLYYVLLAGIIYLLWCRVRKKLWDFSEEKQKRSRSVKFRRRMKLVLPFAVLLLVLLFPEKKGFEMDVLDVGQGDGIYLCTDGGVSMFLDGGSSSEQKVGEYRILPFLKSKGVKEISYWFVSHTDKDHISGLMEVLESGYPVRHVVFAEAVAQEDKTKELAAQAEKAGAEVVYLKAGDRLSANRAEITCLYPAAGETAEDANDLCLTLLFQDGSTKALFAGDISESVEETLVDRGCLQEVDFYKASHHGSNYSSSEAFLRVIDPEITVASAGEDNRYGHPGQQAVERIRTCGSRFLCTIDCGQVKIKRWKEGKYDVFTKYKRENLTKNQESLYLKCNWCSCEKENQGE
ncbi:MAG: ComEC/Rec2 family competence protein [Lachnospiraceae bacterium]|nr:ComEC/Rec2 family competence protein [Lachnospiraceae bacterium]